MFFNLVGSSDADPYELLYGSGVRDPEIVHTNPDPGLGSKEHIIISIFCHGMVLHIYHTGTGTCPRSGVDFYNTNPDPRIRIRITVFSLFGFHCDWFCPDPLVLISVMCLVGIFVLVGVCWWLALLQTVNMLTG